MRARIPWPWSVDPEAAPAPTPPTLPTPSAYTRGLAALDEGDFDAAIAEFSAAIADDPKNPFSYIRRGTAYEKKGDAASAIGDYRKVLTLVDADTGAEYAAKIRKLKKTKK
jgi:Flp pilus assembly protein TadD